MLAAIVAVVVGVLALAVGALLGYALKVRAGRDQVAEAEQSAARILTDAEAKQREALLEAKEEAIRLRSQVENELKDAVPDHENTSGFRSATTRYASKPVARIPPMTYRRGMISSSEPVAELEPRVVLIPARIPLLGEFLGRVVLALVPRVRVGDVDARADREPVVSLDLVAAG